MTASSMIVGMAVALLAVAYFVFLGIVATALALSISIIIGANPFALSGGMAIFFLIIMFELSLMFVFDKPGPIMIAFSTLFIVWKIAVD